MHAHPRSLPYATADDRYLDLALVSEQLPELRRRAVTQYGSPVEREHSGHLQREGRRNRMPDEVDAAVQTVKAPGCKPVVDLPAAEPQANQLRSGHDAVLLCGETSNKGIDPLGRVENLIHPNLAQTWMWFSTPEGAKPQPPPAGADVDVVFHTRGGTGR